MSTANLDTNTTPFDLYVCIKVADSNLLAFGFMLPYQEMQ